MPPTRPRFFFVHLMKTAGSTFLDRFRRLFPEDAQWPPFDNTTMESPDRRWKWYRDYGSLAALAARPEEERHRLEFVAGHFPYAAGELLGSERLATVTILREPVERTLSHLDQFRRLRPELAASSLEELYDDPWIFDRFIRDHQTRMLSMTLPEAFAPRTDQLFLAELLRRLVPDRAGADERRAIEQRLAEVRELGDPATQEVVARLTALAVDVATEAPAVEAQLRREPEYDLPEMAGHHLLLDGTMTRTSPVDQDHFATALAHLEACGAVGVTEDYPGFVHDLNRRYGLECPDDGRVNVGTTAADDTSASFRRRIAEENQFDVALYEAGRELIARRRRES